MLAPPSPPTKHITVAVVYVLAVVVAAPVVTFTDNIISMWGTAVAQWLRCCATNRKVAGSIPDGVIGIFH